MLAAVALHRSYVAGRPIVDTMDAAEHLRSALHVYTTRAAPALGIDAYAQQVYEANLERSRVRSQLATITTIRDGAAIPLR